MFIRRKEMKNKNEMCDSPEGAMKVLKIIGMVILGIAACFAFGLVIMLLWNWLMPMIFGLITLTYWQSIGVGALAAILFGGFGRGGHSDEKKKDKKGNHPIRDEIKKEIAKEFEKEYEKEKTKNKKANLNYEEMYEKWWGAEGENFFEEFTKRSEDNE